MTIRASSLVLNGLAHTSFNNRQTCSCFLPFFLLGTSSSFLFDFFIWQFVGMNSIKEMQDPEHDGMKDRFNGEEETDSFSFFVPIET